MLAITEQWANYLRSIHYKVLLNKKENLLDKKIKDKENICSIKEKNLDLLEKTEKQLLIKLDSQNKGDNKEIYLIGKDISKKKLLEKLNIFKFDGYIFYINKAEEMFIYKIKNMRFIYDLMKKRESYFLIKKIGTYKNKPFFLVKYPICISLDIKEDGSLFYDAESLYNYVNIATKGNLTNLDNKTNLSEFIQKNIIWIVLIIGIVILLMTPQGKEFIQSFIKGIPQK